MTLPAHRFALRLVEEERKDPAKSGRVVTFDYDETITTAPDELAHLATALRAYGDKVVVVTGNVLPRKDLVQALQQYGFPYDDLIQYHDEDTDGLARAEVLKRLGAFIGVDNRADRGYTYAKVCPHLYLIAKPSKESKKASKGADKDAKKTVKKQT